MDRREIQPRVGNGRTEDAPSGQIKAEIGNTRDRIDQTLDALGEKLRPRNIIEEVMDYFGGGSATGPEQGAQQIKGTAQRVGGIVWHQVQEHPMPSLLIGAGIAWLFSEQKKRKAYYGPHSATIREGDSSGALSHAMHSSKETAEGYLHSGKESLQGMAQSGKESIQGMAQSGKEAVQGMAHAGREKLDEVSHDIKERAGRLGTQGKEQASAMMHATEERFSKSIQDYPLAMGLGFMAFGVLAGLAIPHTRFEDRTLGEKADRVKDEVRSRSHQVVETAEKVAMAAGSAAFEEAEKQGLTVQTIGEKLSHIATEAANVVTEKAKEEGFDQEKLKQQVKNVAHEAKKAAQDEMDKSKLT
jgi:ElaB/YqjD/DUF883 family membrane-anchored ribosome-binding protein